MNTETPRSLMGPVTLRVRDLAKCSDYYTSAIGLRVHRKEGNTTFLGAGGEDLLILEGNPEAVRERHTTGLYHVAFLLPSRAALGSQLAHFAESKIPLQGMADHAVSEALYLSDPEGNGIEVYRDLPSEEWKWNKGQIHMTTDPLDVDSLLSEKGNEPWKGMSPGAVVGHVHLRVSDLKDAEQFYRDLLGFDVTTRAYPGAVFLSRDGYHHHIGLNTWTSAGAPSPADNAAGLKQFEIRLRDREEWDAVRGLTKVSGYKVGDEADRFYLVDPSLNEIVIAN